MRKFLLLLILMLPAYCMAQMTVTGKVINLDDKKPVANASVFLNNAQVGNKTNDDGTFTLVNVKPGQYDLIVSIVGYETHSQTIQITSSNIALPEIGLTPKMMMLQEVKVKPDPNWARNYDNFKRLFLGTSENATQCKILNPNVLDLNYDNASRTLNASSYDFLEVENKALGYMIKYKVGSFSNDSNTGILYYEGVSVFEDLKGSSRQIKNWKKARQKAYLGSTMHFLRSCIAARFESEGFKILRLIRKPNPDYKGGPNNKYLQTLVTQPLQLTDFINITDKAGVYALSFTDCLFILYTKKEDDPGSRVYHPISVPNYATTIATFDAPHVFFDDNGIIMNPRDIIFEGDWAGNRIAEMLPVDYEVGK